jgi:hypothetical protein
MNGNIYMQDPTAGHIIRTDAFGAREVWKNYTRMTATAGKIAHREQARAKLLEWLKPGQTVYTILRHCSASGMSSRISLIIKTDDDLQDITGWVADLLDSKGNIDKGITVGGCGMDMGFHLVYNLDAALWPKGTPKPHGKRNGQPDSDGGYALNHRWL